MVEGVNIAIYLSVFMFICSVIVVCGVSMKGKKRNSDETKTQKNSDTIQLLYTKYKKGEITWEEFEQKKKDMEDHNE